MECFVSTDFISEHRDPLVDFLDALGVAPEIREQWLLLRVLLILFVFLPGQR